MIMTDEIRNAGEYRLLRMNDAFAHIMNRRYRIAVRLLYLLQERDNRFGVL